MLIGESGVGKTAIAEGLAQRIVDGNVPEILREKIVFSLEIGYLVAGTKYRGEFEERLKELLEAVKENKILFFLLTNCILSSEQVPQRALSMLPIL